MSDMNNGEITMNINDLWQRVKIDERKLKELTKRIEDLEKKFRKLEETTEPPYDGRRGW